MDNATENDSLPSPASSRVSTPQSQNSFKRTRAKADQVLEKIAKRIDNTYDRPAIKEKYVSFGEHVAEKLRHMDQNMVPICQKLISDAIFFGETHNLNVNSRIVTEYAMPQNVTHYPVVPENSSTTQYTTPTNSSSSSNAIVTAFVEAMNTVDNIH